jgi:hypothetical protein
MFQYLGQQIHKHYYHYAAICAFDITMQELDSNKKMIFFKKEEAVPSLCI